MHYASHSAGIIFPNQLFENSPLEKKTDRLFLIEEKLLFSQYRFNKRKLVFHRASMKFYEAYMKNRGFSLEYIDAGSENSDIRNLIRSLKGLGIDEIHYIDPSDNWLQKRIRMSAEKEGIKLFEQQSPLFMNSLNELQEYFSGKNNFRQTGFYIWQRKKQGILLAGDTKPLGGKWTYDSENRMKYPKAKKPPVPWIPPENEYYVGATDYISRNFSGNPGAVSSEVRFPVTFDEARSWLRYFLKERFRDFGIYQDAIVAEDLFLHHSGLSPAINSGLISPAEVTETLLQFAMKNDIPFNTTEGFIRQIIGWREFIRAVYEMKGSKQRKMNFFGFSRKIPLSFWQGTTGIEPVDIVINKVLRTGYCHHIERLMILGNFMLLCEFDPDEVYRWFMEMFVDACDWVMVPNVYGMSQFADGGLMATKPYISSSNYIKKMSDFRPGTYQKIWDSLFWRFVWVHRDYFAGNPRIGMIMKTLDNMPRSTLNKHIKDAEVFLESLV